MSGISVIVCCYNSALKLPLVLQYLGRQKTVESLNWEVVVVDNNSSDNTGVIALKYWELQDCKKKLGVVKEYKAGLSFARETGIRAAKYDIIIFCDDDNLFAENYLQYSYDLVKRTKKLGYGIWGGKPVEYFDADTNVPEWFEKEKANYVVGAQGLKTGDISDRGYVWGAGMVTLKEIYLKLVNKKFPLLLFGRKGDVLLSGDDSEICLRSLITGYKLYYDENLALKHYIPKDKLTIGYNQGLIKGFSAAHEVLNKYGIFVHYISGRNVLSRFYYACIYKLKYLLNKTGLRTLTSHDITVLHALFNNKELHDKDFDLMRRLMKLRFRKITKI